ncbi:MAG: SDR family oxidoreductase [Saprospiraceae bacterium]|nr:SDR family oxidoreductase [Saprospiraceae bacterium]
MKVLFIGGTGNISAAVSKLALEQGIDLYHLNRGNKPALDGVNNLVADIADSIAVKKMLSNHIWDVVVNWVAFTPEDVIRDIKTFEGKVGQYIFISSASVYQKPPVHYIISETTPLDNPFWDYARNKIACENLLMDEFARKKFPVTIVRPSHTYSTVIPVTLGGWTEYTVIDRIKKGLPVVVQGDGTSLWTLTHADDFAIGFLGLFGNNLALGEAFHITSDEVLTWNQIYEAVAQAAGHTANIVHIPSDYIADYADLHHYPSKRGSLLGDKSYSAVFDNSKIKKFVPTYKANIPFAVGIKNTLHWFESEPTRMIINEQTNKFLDGLIDNFGR